MFNELKLPPPLSQTLKQMGIEQATTVQQAVVPKLLEGQDLLVNAETGSGKTLAFLLPILSDLNHKSPQPCIRALILAPTRELARQIQQVCRQLGKAINVTSYCLTGGVAFKEQKAALRKVPDILVATPGRLKEMLQQNALELTQIKYLVLDEADRMLDMGLKEEVLDITEQVPKCQTLLFSATLEHTGVLSMAAKLQEQPEHLALHQPRQIPEQIQQTYLLADDDAFKEKLLTALLQQADKQQSIIFTNTIEKAKHLHNRLKHSNRRCALLHGNLTQEERNAVVSGMHSGKYQDLIATDVAARGLDLTKVGLVINFDLAFKGDEYLHRVGRTGRSGQSGQAISLIAPHEWDRMMSIQRYLSTAFTRQQLPGLTSRYQGPSKVKRSGKAYGSKKPKKVTKAVNKKSKSGQKKPSRHQPSQDGSAPIKRRKIGE